MRIPRLPEALPAGRGVSVISLPFLLLIPAFATAADREDPASSLPIPARILDAISVVGSPGRAAGTVGSLDTLGRAELDGQNQAYDDIHRVLLRIAGINITEEDGFGRRPNIGMRGVGTERSAGITVMEDGVLAAPAPYAAPAAYYFPVTGRMAGIEVRKGSSQIRFGPRTGGGALNFRSTPIPPRRSLRLSTVAGGDDMKKIHGSYGDGTRRLSWLFESYVAGNSGFKSLDGGGNTGFDLADYIGKVKWRTSTGNRVYQEITFKAGYTGETSYETYLGLTEDDFIRSPFRRYAASGRDVLDADHSSLLLRHHAAFSKTFDLTTTVYRNDFRRNWYKLDKVLGTKIADIVADPGGYAAEYDLLTGGASSDDALSVKANARDYYAEGVETIGAAHFFAGRTWHDVTAGVRLHRDEEDRLQYTDLYRMEGGGEMTLTRPGIPGEKGGGDNRVNGAGAAAFFVEDRIVAGNWSITPGLRFEHIRMERKQYAEGDPDREVAPQSFRNTTDVLIPGMGINYRWAEEIHTFAGVHRGFSPPGPGAADDTRPETSINYELGGRYDHRETSARLTFFFNRYENLLGKDTYSSGGDGSGDLHNAGRVDSYGLEASLAFRAGREAAPGGVSVPVRIAYTLSAARFRNSFESDYAPWGRVEEGDFLPYLPVHQASAGIGVESSSWRIDLFTTFATAMRTEAGHGNVPPAGMTDVRFVTDLTGEYNLNRFSRAFVSVTNLADRVYRAATRPAGARPGLPRRFFAGIKIDI